MDLGSIYRYFAWKSGYQIATADIHSLIGSIGRTNGDFDLFCSFLADDKVFIFLDLADNGFIKFVATYCNETA